MRPNKPRAKSVEPSADPDPTPSLSVETDIATDAAIDTVITSLSRQSTPDRSPSVIALEPAPAPASTPPKLPERLTLRHPAVDRAAGESIETPQRAQTPTSAFSSPKFGPVSDADMEGLVEPAAGASKSFTGFDMWPLSAGVFGSVVMVGYPGRLNIYPIRHSRKKDEPVAADPVSSITNIDGTVVGAKIVEWVSRSDRYGFPLVAVIVHGRAESDAVQPEPTAPATVSTPTTANTFMSDAGRLPLPVRTIEGASHFQTSVRLYSLATGELVDVLYRTAPEPVTSDPHGGVVAKPLPAGSFHLEAKGKFLILSSGVSGDVFVFADWPAGDSDPAAADSDSDGAVQDSGFRCVGHFVTGLHSYLVDIPARSGSGTDQAYDQVRCSRPIVAANSRMLAICPPVRKQPRLVGSFRKFGAFEPAGTASSAEPSIPVSHCRVELQKADMLLQWVSSEVHDRIPNMFRQRQGGSKPTGSTERLSLDPYPPTHASQPGPAKDEAEEQNGVVAIYDLDALLSADGKSRARVAARPIGSFQPPDGVSFLSFSSYGMHLLTVSRTGVFDFVWDIYDIRPPPGAGRTNTGAVHEVSRATRLTRTVVLDVRWGASGHLMLLLTQLGTVHAHVIPPSAFAMERNRKTVRHSGDGPLSWLSRSLDLPAPSSVIATSGSTVSAVGRAIKTPLVGLLRRGRANLSRSVPTVGSGSAGFLSQSSLSGWGPSRAKADQLRQAFVQASQAGSHVVLRSFVRGRKRAIGLYDTFRSGTTNTSRHAGLQPSDPDNLRYPELVPDIKPSFRGQGMIGSMPVVDHLHGTGKLTWLPADPNGQYLGQIVVLEGNGVLFRPFIHLSDISRPPIRHAVPNRSGPAGLSGRFDQPDPLTDTDDGRNPALMTMAPRLRRHELAVNTQSSKVFLYQRWVNIQTYSSVDIQRTINVPYGLAMPMLHTIVDELPSPEDPFADYNPDTVYGGIPIAGLSGTNPTFDSESDSDIDGIPIGQAGRRATMPPRDRPDNPFGASAMEDDFATFSVPDMGLLGRDQRHSQDSTDRPASGTVRDWLNDSESDSQAGSKKASRPASRRLSDMFLGVFGSRPGSRLGSTSPELLERDVAVVEPGMEPEPGPEPEPEIDLDLGPQFEPETAATAAVEPLIATAPEDMTESDDPFRLQLDEAPKSDPLADLFGDSSPPVSDPIVEPIKKVTKPVVLPRLPPAFVPAANIDLGSTPTDPWDDPSMTAFFNAGVPMSTALAASKPIPAPSPHPIVTRVHESRAALGSFNVAPESAESDGSTSNGTVSSSSVIGYSGTVTESGTTGRKKKGGKKKKKKA